MIGNTTLKQHDIKKNNFRKYKSIEQGIIASTNYINNHYIKINTAKQCIKETNKTVIIKKYYTKKHRKSSKQETLKETQEIPHQETKQK